MHIDRSQISYLSFKENELQVFAEMKNTTPMEQFAIITYLRESYYGPEATTGRLQRVFEVGKHQ